MRHRVAERLQFLVGGFQLSGAVLDALLKSLVQSEDSLLRPLALGDFLPQLGTALFGLLSRLDGVLHHVQRGDARLP